MGIEKSWRLARLDGTGWGNYFSSREDALVSIDREGKWVLEQITQSVVLESTIETRFNIVEVVA